MAYILANSIKEDKVYAYKIDNSEQSKALKDYLFKKNIISEAIKIEVIDEQSDRCDTSKYTVLTDEFEFINAAAFNNIYDIFTLGLHFDYESKQGDHFKFDSSTTEDIPSYEKYNFEEFKKYKHILTEKEQGIYEKYCENKKNNFNFDGHDLYDYDDAYKSYKYMQNNEISCDEAINQLSIATIIENNSISKLNANCTAMINKLITSKKLLALAIENKDRNINQDDLLYISIAAIKNFLSKEIELIDNLYEDTVVLNYFIRERIEFKKKLSVFSCFEYLLEENMNKLVSTKINEWNDDFTLDIDLWINRIEEIITIIKERYEKSIKIRKGMLEELEGYYYKEFGEECIKRKPYLYSRFNIPITFIK